MEIIVLLCSVGIAGAVLGVFFGAYAPSNPLRAAISGLFLAGFLVLAAAFFMNDMDSESPMGIMFGTVACGFLSASIGAQASIKEKSEDDEAQ